MHRELLFVPPASGSTGLSQDLPVSNVCGINSYGQRAGPAPLSCCWDRQVQSSHIMLACFFSKAWDKCQWLLLV